MHDEPQLDSLLVIDIARVEVTREDVAEEGVLADGGGVDEGALVEGCDRGCAKGVEAAQPARRRVTAVLFGNAV